MEEGDFDSRLEGTVQELSFGAYRTGFNSSTLPV